MSAAYFFLFLSLWVQAQSKPKIEPLGPPRSFEDFEHQFKGCPANSECDQVMGLQMSRWNDLMNKIKESEFSDSQKSQYIELFRGKYGIPVEFYTLQKSQQTFKPLIFNSACKEHNPKTGDKVLRGMAFLKSLSKQKAIIWRDQTQTELVPGETLVGQPVFVYNTESPIEYLIPLGDQPLLIKNGDLYLLKESEDVFYILRVSKNGDWKIDNLPMDQLSQWEEKRSEIVCPKTQEKLSPKLFGVEFCKSVWNEDLKKNVAVRMYLGCVI